MCVYEQTRVSNINVSKELSLCFLNLVKKNKRLIKTRVTINRLFTMSLFSDIILSIHLLNNQENANTFMPFLSIF